MASVKETRVDCGDGYTVEIEGEATERHDDSIDGPAPLDPPYEIWPSLYLDGELVSSTSVPVPDLEPSTIRAAAFGYAAGWDQG